MYNYMQIKQQTDEEMLKMYLKCSKKKLAEMLIAANKHLNNYSHPFVGSGGSNTYVLNDNTTDTYITKESDQIQFTI